MPHRLRWFVCRLTSHEVSALAMFVSDKNSTTVAHFIVKRQGLRAYRSIRNLVLAQSLEMTIRRANVRGGFLRNICMMSRPDD